MSEYFRKPIVKTLMLKGEKGDQGDGLQNLKVGGRNLYLDTKGFNNPPAWGDLNKWTKTGETYNGFTVISNTKAWFGPYQKIQAKEGETYTFSAYVKNTDGVNAAIYISYSSTVSATVSPTGLTIPQSTDFARYALTFRVTKSGEIHPRVECGVDVANKIEICGLKLERGNVATDWTPAPEDFEAEITKLQAEIDALKNK